MTYNVFGGTLNIAQLNSTQLNLLTYLLTTTAAARFVLWDGWRTSTDDENSGWVGKSIAYNFKLRMTWEVFANGWMDGNGWMDLPTN